MRSLIDDDNIEELRLSRTTNDIGTHSELLAEAALLTTGFEVLKPINPQAYDMVAKRPGTKDLSYIQVKTAYIRSEDKYNGDYVVIKGAKNNGNVYTIKEVDYFIAVWKGLCYIVPNRQVTEYWVRPDNIDKEWQVIDTTN